MDAASLGKRIERLLNTHSSVFSGSIMESGFLCSRCGWCCRENFNIIITEDILRPSNAISVFPEDVRRIMKGTGKQWDEIVQPDIYSSLDDGRNIRVIGWILRRGKRGDCVFYRKGECSIYEWRPMICRCYPVFMGENGIEIMHCEGTGKRMTEESAKQLALLLKRYEIRKLRSFTGIISQLGEKLKLQDLRPLPGGYEGEVIVFDGETISRRRMKKYNMG